MFLDLSKHRTVCTPARFIVVLHYNRCIACDDELLQVEILSEDQRLETHNTLEGS